MVELPQVLCCVLPVFGPLDFSVKLLDEIFWCEYHFSAVGIYLLTLFYHAWDLNFCLSFNITSLEWKL